jgi:hypothetical protein
MTKLHPIQEHHPAVQAAAFRLFVGFACLFFQPARQGIWADTIETLNASHAWSFIICRYDMLFLLFSVTTLWAQYSAPIAIFAPILLAAAAVMPILDDILTTAMPTFMGDGCCYHFVSLSPIT